MPDSIPALRFQWLTPVYDRFLQATMPVGKMQETVLNAIPSDAGRILDFGCGTGRLLPGLLSAFPGAMISGFDPDETALKIAGGKIPENTLCLLTNSFEKILENEPFDCIIASLVLHHIEKPARVHVLKNLKTMLKPGGRLVVMDWKPPRTTAKIPFLFARVFDGWQKTAAFAGGTFFVELHEAGFLQAGTQQEINTFSGTLDCSVWKI